jgi:hypothetical protein
MKIIMLNGSKLAWRKASVFLPCAVTSKITKKLFLSQFVAFNAKVSLEQIIFRIPTDNLFYIKTYTTDHLCYELHYYVDLWNETAQTQWQIQKHW